MNTFKKGPGLSVKINALLFLLAAVIFGAAVVVASMRVRREEKAEQEESSLRSLEMFGRAVDLRLHDLSTLIRLNAQRVSEDAVFGPGVSIVDGGPELKPEISSEEVFIADGSGTIVAADRKELLGLSVRDTAVWKAVSDGRTQYFITPSPMESLASKRPSITIAAPIRSRTQGFRGLLAASFGIGELSRSLLDGWNDGKSGVFSVIDDASTIVAHPDQGLLMTRSTLAPQADAVGTEKGAPIVVEGKDASSRWVRLRSVSWRAGLSIPRNDLLPLSRTVVFLMTAGAAASLIALLALLTLLVGRMVGARLARIARTMESTAAGDLTAVARVTSGDQIGRMAAGFNGLVEGFRVLIGTLSEKMDSLRQTGGDLSSNMEETAAAINQITASLESTEKQIAEQSRAVERTSETAERVSLTVEGLGAMIEGQAQAVAESSSAIEEMVTNIRTVSANTETARAYTGELLSVSADGRKKLSTVIAAIDGISRQSADLMAAAKMISGIAANTNLLAMNASIEAAHAGQWGKGFAVVAEEIRHLAEQSARQSREISKKLNGVKSGIEGAAKTSKETGEAFSLVFEKVEKVGEIVQQIGHAMAEQNEGGRQVLDGLRNINDVTVQVRDGSVQMKEGSGQILAAVTRLTGANNAVRGNVSEIAAGTAEINKAVGSVLELTQSNARLIEEVAAAASRFTIGKS
jgi:methyl-accepting chemotaxis protein